MVLERRDPRIVSSELIVATLLKYIIHILIIFP